MRIHRQILVLALASAVPLAAFATAQARGEKATARVTVGEFAAMLATNTGRGPSLEASRTVDSLVRSGVPLGDLSAPLTERKLVEVLGFYGVQAKSSTPAETVSQGRAAAAILLIKSSSSQMESQVQAQAAGAPSPQTTMDDCLGLSNHGQCVVCCKALGGTATTCSKSCFEINKGSSPEPIP